MFLSDFPVSDQELEALFKELTRCRWWDFSEAVRACLAVAAVGSAVHATEQDIGFREQFLRRLGMDLNPDWDNLYGPEILRFLIDYFDEVDRPGPFRFVRAIYRHAGISHRALPAFAAFLKELRARNGYDYTNWQYRQSLNRVTSRFARDFLETDSGYEFTQSVTRILEDIEKGRIPVEQLEELSGFRRGFWTALFEHLTDSSRSQKERRSFPVPVLALDPISLRLVLRFDEDGIARRAYTVDGRRPIYPRERITRGGAIFGSIFHPHGDAEPWKLDPWVPGRTPWALFRGSDGVFVADDGKVPPGSYYIVSEDDVLSPDMVEEDCGYLDWEQSEVNGVPCRIRKILLKPDVRIESIGLESTSADVIPSLGYIDPPEEWEFGADVFIERLPRIKVRNWTDLNQRLYKIVWDDGRGRAEVEQRVHEGELLLVVAPPAVGRVAIEPRGRVRHSMSMLPELHFHVIPGPLKFQFPDIAIGEDDRAEVSLISPLPWNIEWKDRLVELGPRRWTIPPRTRVLEGIAKLEELRVPIALRVRRCSLAVKPRGDPTNIFWTEDATESFEFLIEGVPGAPCSLLLQTEKDSICLRSLGVLGSSGLVTLRALEFRDFLVQSNLACGEFAVLAGKQIVSTGQFLLAAKHIPRVLESTDSNWAYFEIPGVGPTLKSLWSIYKSPQAEVEVGPKLIKSHLGKLIADVILAAAVIDGTRVNVSSAELRRYATPRLLVLLDFIEAARSSSEAIVPDIQDEDLKALPLERWRKTVTQIVRQQDDLKNVPAILEEWRSEICASFQVEYQSRMYQRRGGRDLTQAAIKYRLAVTSGNRRAYDVAYGILRRITLEETDSLVKAVAYGLLQLTLYRSGRTDEAAALFGSNLPRGFARLEAEMTALSALCRGDLTPQSSLPSGVGLEDFSPVDEDKELFARANQPLEGARRENREESV